MLIGRCCRCSPTRLSDWARLIRLSSILTTDTTIADYTTAWTYNSGVGDYQVVVSGAPTTTGANRGLDRWVRKMRPIRYRIGGNPSPTQYPMGVYRSGSLIAFRDTSVPYDGHTKGEVMQSVNLRGPFYSQMTTEESKLVYIRVRINSVDSTGAVPVSAPLSDRINFAQNYRTCVRLLDFALNNSVSFDNLVEIDFWFYLSFTRNECGLQLQPDALNPFTLPWHLRAFTFPAGGSFSPSEYHATFTGSNCNARVGRSDVFQVTWDSDAPGGATTLVFEPQANWTYTQVSDTSILMTKASAPSAGDTVRFNWGREIPEIIAHRPGVAMPVGLAPLTRYLPADTGHYTPSQADQTNGIWEPASTVFPLMGAALLYPQTSAVWSTQGLTAITNMPSTCTLERV